MSDARPPRARVRSQAGHVRSIPELESGPDITGSRLPGSVDKMERTEEQVVGGGRAVSRTVHLALVAVLIALGVLRCGASASAAVPVPAEYQPMYETLRAELGAPVAVRPAAQGPSPVWGAHLLVADSNRGPILLSTRTMQGVELVLDRFKELGIEGVSVAIGYPLLTPTRNPESQRYLDFYKAVAAQVRARGMKFTVEQNVLYDNSNFSPWSFDLSGLTMQEMIEENHTMAQTIIDELHPDYLTVLHEPDTFAVLTGLEQFFDPTVAASYVAGVLNGLNRDGTLVGAGSGTWSGPGFAAAILHDADIDYLDLHIYWMNRSSVESGKEMVELARAYGKPVTIDEAWLYKSVGEGAEGLPGLLGNELVFRRDVFSFFEPLDRSFLRSLARFAVSAGALYVAPYWSNMFFSYLEYGPATKELPYRELETMLEPEAVEQAVIADRFTRTGRQYARIIKQHP